MRENYYCHIKNFQTLIRELKKAQKENDTEKILEIHGQLAQFNKQCGTPITTKQLKEVINIEDLEEFELRFLRNAPSVIMRDLEQGDTKNAEIVYRAIQDYMKQSHKKYTMIGFNKYEILSDGSLKIPEPEPEPPEIPRMLTDSQLMLRNKHKKEKKEQ